MREFILVFLGVVIFFCLSGLSLCIGFSVFKPITFIEGIFLAIGIFGVGVTLNAARGGDN